MIAPLGFTEAKTEQEKITVPVVYKRGLYKVIFERLFIHSQKNGGISRDRLVQEIRDATGKEERLIKYAVSIVTSATSPEEGGKAHKSCKADLYYIQREGSFLKVIMRDTANISVK